MEGERVLYPSYAGLNRTAMIWGIPLVAGLIVFAASLMFSLLGAVFMGPGGFLLGLPGIPVLLFFKHLCVTDDQALRIVWFEVLCVLRRANTANFGRTYTLAPMRYGRSFFLVRQALARSPSLDVHERFVSRFLAELAREKQEAADEAIAQFV